MRKNLQWSLSLVLFMVFFGMGSPGDVNAQIYEPQGLNMPGAWNGWTNPPTNNLALASSTQVTNGRVTKISFGTARYQTIIKVAESGGDITGGTYEWLFTSGPSNNYYQNKWGSVGTVTMNSLQNYTLDGSNNNITVSNGKWYTTNWKDAGYANTSAIFMETSAEPVTLSAVTQTPLAANVFPGQSVTVNITASATPCAEEKIYVRYSTNDFVNSTLVEADFTGTSGTATIPATSGTVKYYVFSTTVASPTADFDLYSIKINNNSNAYYSYTANTSWLTTADGNWSSTLTWQGGVLPLSGQPVTIANNVTLDQAASVSTLTINADKTFTASDASSRVLTFSTGGTLTNNGTFTHGSGKVAFAGTGTITGTLSFFDVDIAGGVNFGAASAINGTLTINPGGYVNTNSPTYSTGSTLKYNTGGDYAVASEWKSNTTSGQGVPHHVEIASSSPVRLTGAAFYQLNGNLTINADKAFQLSTTVGGDLQIKGNLVNNGTLTHQSRLITFNGSSAQEIQGGATTFAYVTIDNVAGVSINNTGTITIANNLVINAEKKLTINPGKSLTVTGSITNNAGDGGLVIESDATGTGSLINNTSGVDATVKRYLTQNYYHYISSPVAAQVISPEFINTSDLVINQSAIDLFKFDEITNTWDNIKNGTTWDDDFEDNFNIAKGYVYAYRTSNVTKNFAGQMNMGDKTIKLTVTPDQGNGWNLIGNPFVSTLAATTGAQATDNLIDANSSLYESGYAALYFWKEQAGYSGTARVAEYEVINNLSGEYYVNPGQAFMIKAKTHNSDYAFTANMRKHGTSAFYKSTNSDDYGRFYLTITGPEGDYNETLLGFVPEATNGLDEGFDAIKLKGNPNIALYSKLINGDDGDFAIQALPSFTGNEVIPIGLDANKTGTYSFSAGNRENLDNISIKIEDRLTNTFTTLEGSTGYSFTVLTSSTINNRFYLHFKSSVGIEDQATAETAIYSYGKTLYFETSGKATLEVFNLTGQKTEYREINSAGLQTLGINAPTGWYIVKLVSSGSVTSKKVFIN